MLTATVILFTVLDLLTLDLLSLTMAFHVILDRFEANIDFRAAKLKRQMCDMIDKRVASLKQKVARIRKLGPARRQFDLTSLLASSDGTRVEMISREDYANHRRDQLASAQANPENDLTQGRNVASTSTGIKRKSSQAREKRG